MNNIADLQKKLGYVFKDIGILRDALTHTSVEGYQPHLMGYERLEFLGDRVLGLVASEMLLNKFKDEAEGDIAKRHTAIVQRKALVKIAKKLSIGDYLYLSESEINTGGREKEAILSDAMEATIAAIYLDGGFQASQDFIKQYWVDLIDGSLEPSEDPKTALQEWAQGRGKPLPKYEMTNKTGTQHEPVFEMEVSVEGYEAVSASAASKRKAEKKAATMLLEKINLKDKAGKT